MTPTLIEPTWIALFENLLVRCQVKSGDTVAILRESQSRFELVESLRHACSRLQTKAFILNLPTQASPATPIIRSTGASTVLCSIEPVIAALAGSSMVFDCTVEGLMHAPELPAILRGTGGEGQTAPKVVYVSNEHPEALLRLIPEGDALEQSVKLHSKRLRSTKGMRVTSAAGTDLLIDLQGAPSGGNWGYTARAGTMSHFPGGLVLAFPKAGSVNGRLVLGVGDVNLAFKRYIEQPIALTIEADCITRIEGEGVDAQLMREYIAAWGDREAYAASHVGYGLNPAARFDSMAMFDRRDFNGTELRCAAGSFLYSTGANETAGRYTLGHFDLPMKHCTIALDGVQVVRDGQLLDFSDATNSVAAPASS